MWNKVGSAACNRARNRVCNKVWNKAWSKVEPRGKIGLWRASALLADSRSDDLCKAVCDKSARAALYEEYRL